ncbi:uncharacterized protein LOC129599094 [Paramacrobiotus metropolitanus]|uniref:uncharacterized protein LOC129599094 n=1 Tax=Paramacrobiotus metropolitanus TaxID=2943436 RepID=UPI002445601B|nr:uncharacterized protein LOC129599094 [Paramacrobiotus metropolitanus]
MFVYDPLEQSLYAWNAVEVFVDGLLQLGRVINVVEKGLVIDFGCATQRSQFIEYRRIFHACKARSPHPVNTYQEYREYRNVQVLFRAGPDRPWAWYPGTAVSLGEQSYFGCVYIVEVKLPHGVVKELLPRNQVRRPPSDADLAARRVQDKDFVIRGCPLPAAPRELGDLLASNLPPMRRVLCTEVLNETLLYLQRRLDREMQPQELDTKKNT